MKNLTTINEDTICAIATSVANNAISIIKISGTKSKEIVSKIFTKDLSKVATHTIHYGKIKDGSEIIDEVLVSVFNSPRSFTCEDVVEINCHGGVFVTNKVLELLLTNGCRLAEAGEFTKRAFLNGRIDLTQAEAVMDVIEANTNNSLKLASLGLLGETKKLIKKLRDRLLNLTLQVEVNIDYPEYEDEVQINEKILQPELEKINLEFNNILAKAEVSQVIKHGIKTAIVGRPNVGKSSLLNALLREEKAIVTSIAGTTRDIVEGEVNIGGVVLKLIDTAGIRETDDKIEQIGVKKSLEALKDAELAILVLDNSQEINDVDLELLKATKDMNRIIVINKKDLKQKLNFENEQECIKISSFNTEDINALQNKIKDYYAISDLGNLDGTYIGTARQIAKLREAQTAICDAISSLKCEMPIDIVNIDIHNAWYNLGEIIGEVSSEELIDELFSRFCLGK